MPKPAGVSLAAPADRARLRALIGVAILNAAYALAASSTYGWSFIHNRAAALLAVVFAACLLVVEVLLLGLPAYLLGAALWRAGRRRLAVIVCIVCLTLAGMLLRIDAILSTLFSQHVYGMLAVACVLQGDADALAMTGRQIALYALEAAALVGFQAPAYKLLKRFFLRYWSEPTTRWLKTAAFTAAGVLFVGAAAAVPASRYSREHTELLELQRRFLVPLAWEQPAPPPPGVSGAVAGAFSRAMADAEKEPAWLKPVEIAGAARRRPNIVMIFTESLRADAFSPEVTPEIWRFSRSATVASQHYANGNATYLSLFSVATGLSPAAWDESVRRHLPPPPLAALKQSGYRMHLISSCSMKWWGMNETVFPSGMFDSYVERRGDPVADDQASVREAMRVIDSAGGEPFFLFVFLYATHWSYYFPPDCARFEPFARDVDNQIGPELAERRGEVHNRYLNSAYFVDRCAGRIFRRLDDKGLLENTVVVFSSDHGESFHETGAFCHGNSLAEQETAVPMVVRWPGRMAQKVQGITQHDDLFPSIFKYMEVESPQLSALSGRPSLLDGQGSGRAVIGAAGTGSPRRWLLRQNDLRITFLLPPGTPRLVIEACRDGSGPVGEPRTQPASRVDRARIADDLGDWLTRARAPFLLRAARDKGDL